MKVLKALRFSTTGIISKCVFYCAGFTIRLGKENTVIATVNELQQ